VITLQPSRIEIVLAALPDIKVYSDVGVLRSDRGRATLSLLPEEPIAVSDAAERGSDSPTLIHPKYKLPAQCFAYPAQCFAYVGNYAKTATWKLPYLLADRTIDAKRLPKAVQCILSNYRGTKVTGIPEEAIPAVLERLAKAARQAGHMPPEACNPAPILSSAC
jgi:hypothetical protein